MLQHNDKLQKKMKLLNRARADVELVLKLKGFTQNQMQIRSDGVFVAYKLYFIIGFLQ